MLILFDCVISVHFVYEICRPIESIQFRRSTKIPINLAPLPIVGSMAFGGVSQVMATMISVRVSALATTQCSSRGKQKKKWFIQVETGTDGCIQVPSLDRLVHICNNSDVGV